MSAFDVAAHARALLRDDPDGDEADAWLDLLYPPEYKRFRTQHATPVEVSRMAAAWLAESDGARVLDVGAGAGRFCLTGAITTAAHFTGVERRAHLVEAAREVASRLGADRASFLAGDVRDVAWTDFTGFYLFNPFGEHLLPDDERIDDAVAHDRARFEDDVRFVEAQLARCPDGARVVTWNGFGGMLDGWRCVRRVYVRHVALDCLLRDRS